MSVRSALLAALVAATTIYYYFGVIRAIYWGSEPADATPIAVTLPVKCSLGVCIVGMLFLGVYPATWMRWVGYAVDGIR